MIAAQDLDLMQVIDDPAAVVDAIFSHYETRGFEPSPAEREVQFNLSEARHRPAAPSFPSHHGRLHPGKSQRPPPLDCPIRPGRCAAPRRHFIRHRKYQLLSRHGARLLRADLVRETGADRIAFLSRIDGSPRSGGTALSQPGTQPGRRTVQSAQRQAGLGSQPPGRPLGDATGAGTLRSDGRDDGTPASGRRRLSGQPGQSAWTAVVGAHRATGAAVSAGGGA